MTVGVHKREEKWSSLSFCWKMAPSSGYRNKWRGFLSFLPLPCPWNNSLTLVSVSSSTHSVGHCSLLQSFSHSHGISTTHVVSGDSWHCSIYNNRRNNTHPDRCQRPLSYCVWLWKIPLWIFSFDDWQSRSVTQWILQWLIRKHI